MSRSDGSSTEPLFNTGGSRLVFKVKQPFAVQMNGTFANVVTLQNHQDTPPCIAFQYPMLDWNEHVHVFGLLQDQYLEISSKIPSSTTLYGLGEQASSTGFALRRDGLPYTLWTRDQPPNVPNVNSYGSHPFIMDVRKGVPCECSFSWKCGVTCADASSSNMCHAWGHACAVPLPQFSSLSLTCMPQRTVILCCVSQHAHCFAACAGGQAHGVLLLNSNGIDVVLTKTRMQFRAIGGVLDMYFFLGPTPLQVLAQLTSVIGRPVMPPYWSMGLQQSK